MKYLSLIFAICITSRIAPIFGRFYVLKDDEGGAYFFEESDLKSKNPTKTYYFLTPDDYQGPGELVTEKIDDGYESDNDFITAEDFEVDDENIQTLDDDIYQILKNLEGLKLKAAKTYSPKKQKYRLIPGDFQTRVQHPQNYKQASLAQSLESDAEESFMGLPTSHLASIMKLLDDVALDGSAKAVRSFLPNEPHVELTPGIPKNENVHAPKPDLITKLQKLMDFAQKVNKNGAK